MIKKHFSLHLINENKRKWGTVCPSFSLDEKQCIVPYSFQKFHRRFYHAVILYWQMWSQLAALQYKESFSSFLSPFKILFRWLALTDFLRLDSRGTSFFYILNDCGIQKKPNLCYHMFVQLKKSKQANKQIIKHPLDLMHSSYICQGFQARRKQWLF